MFTDTQKKALAAKLDPAHVSSRNQSGRSLSYIEGWWAEAEANRIFGFDGWTSEVIEVRCVSERERMIGRDNPKPGFGVSYVATVRVTAGGVVRDGVGAGHGIDVDPGLAHESAIKEATTDAEKRALKTFGNPFGLALYDKTQANVGSPRKSAAQAKRDGDHERIKETFAAMTSLAELDAWARDFDQNTAELPISWLDPIRDEWQHRRNAIIEDAKIAA